MMHTSSFINYGAGLFTLLLSLGEGYWSDLLYLTMLILSGNVF